MSWPLWNQSVPQAVPAPEMMGLSGFTPEQWALLQQQNWQQWTQWQTQYSQWQMQYGDKYAEQLKNMNYSFDTQPPLPSMVPTAPPPPPPDGPPPTTSGATDNITTARVPPMADSSDHRQPPYSSGTVQPVFDSKKPPPNINQPPNTYQTNSKYQTSNYGSYNDYPPNRQWKDDDQYNDNRHSDNRFDYNRPQNSDYSNFSQKRMQDKKVDSNYNKDKPSLPKDNPNMCSDSDMTEEERQFDIQFIKWEEDFFKWKEQNVDHPDKVAYREYEMKFEACRAQLIERKEQMKARRKATNTADVSSTDHGKQSQNLNNPPPEKPLESEVSQNNEQDYPTNFEDRENYDNYSQDNEYSDHYTQDSADLFPPTNVQGKGIPGLDLVEPETINLADETEQEKLNGDEIVEGLPQKPDLSALSKGINNILGDEKLLNMLSMVTNNNRNQDGSDNQTNIKTIAGKMPSWMSESRDSSNSNSSNPMSSGNNATPQQNRNQSLHPVSGNSQPINTRGIPPLMGNIIPGMPNLMPGMNNTWGMNQNMGNVQNPMLPGMGNMQQGMGPMQQGMGPMQSRMGNMQPGIGNLQPGMGNVPPGIGKVQAGIGNMQPGMGNIQPGMGNMQSGMGNMQTGMGNMQSGMGNMQSGMGNMQPGMGNMQPAMGNIQSGMGNMQPGMGNMQHGMGNMQHGNLSSRMGGIPSADGSMSGMGGNISQGMGNSMQKGMRGLQQGMGNIQEMGNIQQGMGNMQQGMGSMQQGMNMQRNMPQGMRNSQQLNRMPQEEYDNADDRFQGSRSASNQNWNKNNDMYNSGFQSRNNFNNKESNFAYEQNKNSSEYVQGGMDYDDCQNRRNSGVINQRNDVTDENVPKPRPSWIDVPLIEPVTIVDYQHKSIKRASDFMEPVQTFDYGHKSGSNSSKMESRFDPTWIELDTYQKRAGTKVIDYQNKPIDESRRDADPWVSNKYKGYDSPTGSRFDDKYKDDRYDRFRRSERYEREFKEERRHMGDRDDKRFNDDREYIRYIEGREERRYYDDREDRRYVDDRGRRERSRERGIRYEKSNSQERIPRRFSETRDLNLPLKEEEEKFSDRTKKIESKSNNVVMIDDLLESPGRDMRPAKIVIILRGLPGSGKSYLAKLIKERELENGGSALRILSIDDYFISEVENVVTDPDTGKKETVREMKYEYDQSMEDVYVSSLLKSFKRTLSENFFSFVIVDGISNQNQFKELISFAKQSGFMTYICEMDNDVQACFKRNIHNRTLEDIQALASNWFPTLPNQTLLDPTTLLQNAAIDHVQMEDVSCDEDNMDMDLPDQNEEEEVQPSQFSSKWDRMDDTDKLARLDGTSKPLRHTAHTMEDFLQLDDWTVKKTTQPGKKTVRWADIEERREQEKMRAIGFVVGQTDWNRMTDPTKGSSALTQTKYIERVKKY